MEEKRVYLNDGWRVFCIKNDEYEKSGFQPSEISDFNSHGGKILKATVPSCLEKVLIDNGECEDLYFSDNVFKNRKNEYLHHFWFTTFDCAKSDITLTFEGIDTVADVIVNGETVGRAENMFVPHSFRLTGLKRENNELIVHIYPAVIEARKYPAYPNSYSGKYNRPSLVLRKCASSFGWDILPRIVCGGIFRPVYLEEEKTEKINQYYLYVKKIFGSGATSDAVVELFYDFTATQDEIEDYAIEINGSCGKDSFHLYRECWFNKDNVCFEIKNGRLWWPKGYGEQNLYDVRLNLIKRGRVVDSARFKFGLRTVGLERSSWAKEDGKFNFIVNGKKIFILGVNWSVTDAMHYDDENRAQKCIKLVDESGCNAIRVWGGGVYESEKLFDYCDEKGILIWQDFMMGCADYPQDERMIRLIREEAEVIIKKYRQHASLLVWAGDNECDVCSQWNHGSREPFRNVLTRQVIPAELYKHDGLRPYIPSSPYVDEEAFLHTSELAEDHLWGPRDYFKSDFYRNAKAFFSSETGYHGLNGPESLKKFLARPERFFDEKGNVTAEYLAHASAVENSVDSPYAFRIKLLLNQIDVLFGNHDGDLADVCKKSQISQAEALKYFIERFRVRRNTHGGIIWWNIVDGWPQVSDAVVDYYFSKKLAFGFIKRSQRDLALIMEEKDGKTYLYGVNDKTTDEKIKFTVENVYEGKPVYKGETTLKSCESKEIAVLDIPCEDKSFYSLRWEGVGFKGDNHFHTNIKNIDYEKYSSALNKVGYDEWEGF